MPTGVGGRFTACPWGEGKTIHMITGEDGPSAFKYTRGDGENHSVCLGGGFILHNQHDICTSDIYMGGSESAYYKSFYSVICMLHNRSAQS